MLCFGAAVDDENLAIALIWDNPDNPAGKPHMIKFPRSIDVKPIQGTWYQGDNGKIYMYLRDCSLSCKLGLSISEDGGMTWSIPMLTDFPNTFSRAYAGNR